MGTDEITTTKEDTTAKLEEDEGWLHEKYWGEDLSLLGLARLANCSQTRIRNQMEKFGIQRRTPGGRPSQKPVTERFWEKVEGGPNCWEWQAGRGGKGYGQFWDGNKKRYAHRFAWELENGPIPEGAFVCHHCDNMLCVRIDHLFLGDNTANMADCAAKGRSALGEKNGQARLTRDNVREIRRLVRETGMTGSQIGETFGVSQAHISNIAIGKRWGWLE